MAPPVRSGTASPLGVDLLNLSTQTGPNNAVTSTEMAMTDVLSHQSTLLAERTVVEVLLD